MNEDQTKIIDYYTRGRNRKCSVIFLSQNYYSIHKKIRENTDYLVLLKLRGIRNLNMIVNEYNFIDNKDLVKKMYYDATSEKFSCFIVDNIKSEYRKNLLGKYQFSNEGDDEDSDQEAKAIGHIQVITTDVQSIEQSIKSIGDALYRILADEPYQGRVFYLDDGAPITIFIGDNLKNNYQVENETFENEEEEEYIDNALTTGMAKLGV